jgi:hypothetical protein
MRTRHHVCCWVRTVRHEEERKSEDVAVRVGCEFIRAVEDAVVGDPELTWALSGWRQLRPSPFSPHTPVCAHNNKTCSTPRHARHRSQQLTLRLQTRVAASRLRLWPRRSACSLSFVGCPESNTKDRSRATARRNLHPEVTRPAMSS